MRLLTLLLLFMASPAMALNEGLQCVPYARAVSGIAIRGDAHTWWAQADGRYQRGSRPKVGAVMSFKPFGASALGHVAAVTKIIDKRNVLVSHANWSRINGTRGHIEENVQVADVSEAGDWSEVKVWFAASQALGTTAWPLSGFIYPDKVLTKKEVRMAVANLTGRDAAQETAPDAAKAPVRIAAYAPTFQLSSKTLADVNGKAASEKKTAWQRPASVTTPAAAQDGDVIGDLIGALGS